MKTAGSGLSGPVVGAVARLEAEVALGLRAPRPGAQNTRFGVA